MTARWGFEHQCDTEVWRVNYLLKADPQLMRTRWSTVIKPHSNARTAISAFYLLAISDYIGPVRAHIDPISLCQWLYWDGYSCLDNFVIHCKML